MKIYLDFDGTVVEHTYPGIGRCNFGCVEVIKKLQDAGHEIILNTMRCEFNDGSLEKAIKWFDNAYMFVIDKSIDRFNFDLKPITSTTFKHNPGYWDWEYFKNNDLIMIDDICNGIPLKNAAMSNGKIVDWNQLDLEFKANGIY